MAEIELVIQNSRLSLSVKDVLFILLADTGGYTDIQNAELTQDEKDLLQTNPPVFGEDTPENRYAINAANCNPELERVLHSILDLGGLTPPPPAPALPYMAAIKQNDDTYRYSLYSGINNEVLVLPFGETDSATGVLANTDDNFIITQNAAFELNIYDSTGMLTGTNAFVGAPAVAAADIVDSQFIVLSTVQMFNTSGSIVIPQYNTVGQVVGNYTIDLANAGIVGDFTVTSIANQGNGNLLLAAADGDGNFVGSFNVNLNTEVATAGFDYVGFLNTYLGGLLAPIDYFAFVQGIAGDISGGSIPDFYIGATWFVWHSSSYQPDAIRIGIDSLISDPQPLFFFHGVNGNVNDTSALLPNAGGYITARWVTPLEIIMSAQGNVTLTKYTTFNLYDGAGGGMGGGLDTTFPNGFY